MKIRVVNFRTCYMERRGKKVINCMMVCIKQSAPEASRLNKGIPDNRVCYLHSAILQAYLIHHMPDLTAKNPDRSVHD